MSTTRARQPAMVGYPHGFQSLLWTTISFLGVTGALLIPAALETRFEYEMPLLPPGWRVTLAASHATLAFMSLMIVGALLAVHVRIGLRRRRNRLTGFVALGALGLQLLTALVLYYVADEDMARYASALHIASAIVLAAILIVHVVIGRAQHRQRTTHH